MRKTKVRRGIIAIVLLVVALFFIVGTYARYSTVGSATAIADIAKWNVLIKSGDTTLNSTTQNVDFTISPSEYVVSNKIAPSIKATANIDLYLEGTEVAVDFNAIVDKSGLSEVISNNANIISTVTFDGNTYETGDTILVGLPDGSAFSSENGTKRLTITLEWTDSESNNANDTAVGIASDANRHISVPVTITAQQHI